MDCTTDRHNCSYNDLVSGVCALLFPHNLRSYKTALQFISLKLSNIEEENNNNSNLVYIHTAY